jgi:hypothetical protein
MSDELRAGFHEIDITPPIGTRKIGWIIEIVSEYVADPLCAHIAVFECGAERVAFIQLDTLSIRWTQANDIRRRLAERYGFPGGNVMVCATHSHAGPAIASTGEVPRDEACVETLVQKVVEGFGLALENLQPAQVGFGSTFNFAVGHNRRVVMRDGTVKTHGTFADPNALFIEGPIDPEVAVIAARKPSGELLGALVNYSCHPTHHGPDGAFSAGYPGVLATNLREAGCPVALYLNGASGNVHTGRPAEGGSDTGMEEAGRMLADDALKVIAGMTFRDTLRLGSKLKTIQLPYRTVTDDEIRGTAYGAQRFVDPGAYDRGMPALVERIRQRGMQPADVQVHFLDEYAIAAIPAEYFVELGLKIKESAYPRHALIAATSNGMVGYVPTRQAFVRGGYETTFTGSSRMAPEAGDMLADCAIEIIREAGPLI